jgi:hypothetical protein
MCGVIITFGELSKNVRGGGVVLANKFSKLSASYSITSRPAAFTLPDFNASTKALVSTILPLEILIK